MPLVERCVIGVDIEGFSALVERHQLLVQKELDRVLDEAAESTGLPRADWVRQPAGDGELAVLPPDVDLVALVRTFTRELDWRLADHNEDHASARIRLRLAMHTDVVAPGPFGYAGPGLIVLSRLLDAPALRRGLKLAPDEHVVQAVSEPLYRKAVLPQLGGLRPEQFHRTEAVLPGKRFRQDVYLHFPRGGRPAPRAAASPSVLLSLVRTPPAPASASEPVAAPPAPVLQPLPPHVRELVDGVHDALAAGEVGRADRLTTLALLAQANRRSFLRGADAAKLTDTLFAELDGAWSETSGGRWGFGAQRERLAHLVLSGQRPFLDICLALGWRARGDDFIPLYPEFATHADDSGAPFYPTLRDPEHEDGSLWHGEWTATVLATHVRLRDWEG
ncbi:hypothetical protein GCM10022243_10180 [Saccharothrix violaceirubra]|uniref:Class 3 adenylate cyclase n=1 Tax=Saccharothrix violaceirubra TaxID=413306 RepID=A0A7W7T404_9PSEU|nr:hypothetical protein [Saccharothrix violaceirubra]MBB4966143.1 class 3 adenylate cyclase [Saccharothrix violaceirubra]